MDSGDALFFAWFTVVLGLLIFVTVLPAFIFARWMLRQTERSLMMLVLKRKPLQSILIGENIRVTVVSIDQGRVKVGIEAPNDISVIREELLEEKEEVQYVQGSN